MKHIYVVTILLLAAGCSRSAPIAEQPTATGTVTIEILGNQGAQTIQVADVATGTSLEQVMRELREVPVELSGSGTTAFVDAIGERATNSTEGWTFKVDGEFANQGIGATTLKPPTTVTWSFGDFDGDE